MSGAWSTTQTWSCLVGGGQPRVSSPQVKNCPFLLFFPFAQLSICSSDQLSLELHGTSIASGFQWCSWRTKQPTTKSHQEEREWVFKLIQFLKKKKISAEPAGAFFRCWEIGGKARSVSHIKPGLAPPALRFRLQQVMRVFDRKKNADACYHWDQGRWPRTSSGLSWEKVERCRQQHAGVFFLTCRWDSPAKLLIE